MGRSCRSASHHSTVHAATANTPRYKSPDLSPESFQRSLTRAEHQETSIAHRARQPRNLFFAKLNPSWTCQLSTDRYDKSPLFNRFSAFRRHQFQPILQQSHTSDLKNTEACS